MPPDQLALRTGGLGVAESLLNQRFKIFVHTVLTIHGPSGMTISAS